MKCRISIGTRLYPIGVSVADCKGRGVGLNSSEHATNKQRKIPDKPTAILIWRDNVSELIYRPGVYGRIVGPVYYQRVIDDNEWITPGEPLRQSTLYQSLESRS